MVVRVALVEDQRLVRQALGALLAREPGIEVVGEAANGRDAIALAHAKRPDVMLLDISLPDIDGIEVARILRRQLPEVKVIALSMHNEQHVVQKMLAAGAIGYVDKSSAYEELPRAVRAVMQGQIYLSPEVTRSALAPVAAARKASISQREREVLALLAAGKRSRQIAEQLHVSTATVEVHRRNIMRKLGLRTVAELTHYAIREGLVSL